MSMFKIAILCVFYVATLARSCPPKEDLAPICECRKLGGEFMMTCKGVLNPEQLIGPMRSVAMHKVKLFALSIDDSSLQYIPDNIFQGTSVEKLQFINSEIMSLSDTDVAFSGLEDTLMEIRASEANYIASWDWQQLRNLKNIELIDVKWITMSSIDEPFPHLPKLNALGITKASISFIEDAAFSKLPNLRILTLKDNDITEIKRSMLPDTAEHLIIMDLSNNQISYLPEDFFTNMPSIEIVHLDDNQFVTLPEEPFSSAFDILNDFTMNGNPFRCDCRMRWLADNRVPSHFIGECTAPESLKGHSINSLAIKHLWC